MKQTPKYVLAPPEYQPGAFGDFSKDVKISQLLGLLQRWQDVFGRQCQPDSPLMRDTRKALEK